MKRKKQNKPELWFEQDRRLLHAKTVTNRDTGEVFELDDKLVRIYTYMLDQYNSYHANRQQFYEDQRDIAAKCCCTAKTAGKWIGVLEALGLVQISKSHRCHTYIVRSIESQADNLMFEYPTLRNGKPSYNHEKALACLRASRSPAQQQLHF